MGCNLQTRTKKQSEKKVGNVISFFLQFFSGGGREREGAHIPFLVFLGVLPFFYLAFLPCFLTTGESWVSVVG